MFNAYLYANDENASNNNLDLLDTDIDLYKRLKYLNNYNDMNIKIEIKNFIDVNSGYVKDYKSYKKFL